MPRRRDVPRDLLFGLLALQNGMVNQPQLIAAVGVWTASPGSRRACLWRCRPCVDSLQRSGSDSSQPRDHQRVGRDVGQASDHRHRPKTRLVEGDPRVRGQERRGAEREDLDVPLAPGVESRPPHAARPPGRLGATGRRPPPRPARRRPAWRTPRPAGCPSSQGRPRPRVSRS